MTQRSLLVTGASSGLGAGLAASYAAPGVRLALVGRDAGRLDATAALCRRKGAETVIGTFDVAEPEPFGAWLRAQDAAHPFDMLLACAGVSAGTSKDDRPEGRKLATMQVRTNLLGAINTIEPLLPAMIARRRGQIAVVSSIAGLHGLPYSPGYSASKAGVRAYGEALRALVAPSGVAVSVIVPGFFDTPMTDRWEGPKPFMVSLDKMVAIIRKGLDAKKPRIVSPRLFAFGNHLTDFMPAWLGDRIHRGFRFHIRPGQ